MNWEQACEYVQRCRPTTENDDGSLGTKVEVGFEAMVRQVLRAREDTLADACNRLEAKAAVEWRSGTTDNTIHNTLRDAARIVRGMMSGPTS